MDERTREKMKQLIEAKKNKGNMKGNSLRPDRKIGDVRGGFSTKKSGGLFDK